MVEGTSLENWRARKGTVSSNLTPSARRLTNMTKELWTAVLFLLLAASTPLGAKDAVHAECLVDIEKFCPGIEPGGFKIYRCLNQHYDEIDPGCQAQLQGERKAWIDACKTDQRRFCATVKQERGGVRECLATHRSELSEACRSEW